ncbi:MAG: helix-turn-helix domain-containing protein, partial [Phycicoccus sp.]
MSEGLLAHVVRVRRQALRLTQSDLARLMGLSTAAVSRIERAGGGNPQIRTRESLERAL